MEQEYGMHRLADRLVATERERKVRDAAGDMHAWQFAANRARSLKKGDGIVIMFFDSGRNREDVGIEDDVLRRKADVVDQDLVGTLANRHFARGAVGLTAFVKRHDDHGSAVAPDQFRLADERGLALFERNRVDDPFALQAPEP